MAEHKSNESTDRNAVVLTIEFRIRESPDDRSESDLAAVDKANCSLIGQFFVDENGGLEYRRTRVASRS